MKKRNLKAVAAIMIALCSEMFIACSDDSTGYNDGLEKTPVVTTDVKKTGCAVTLNTYKGAGVVATRATAVEHLDGTLTTVSRVKATFENCLDADSVRTYEIKNLIEARGVNKPRYAKSLDSFKEQNFTMTETTFENGQVGKFVKFQDGNNHNFYYSFIISNELEKDTFQIWNPSKKKFDVIERCNNEISSLEFLNQEAIDLGRDSADWHAYKVIHNYAGMLEEGPNNGFAYSVTIPLVWVAKEGKNPEFPDEDDPTPIHFDEGDEGFDFVNDSTSQSWKDLIPTLSDGTKGKADRIAVLLKNTIEEPEYQILQVESFDYTEQPIQAYDENAIGTPYEKENKISVQRFVKSVVAKTNKCNAPYKLYREGRPVFTDSLGGKHYLPERQWTAADKSWDDKEMTATENFDRLLLTNIITATFNEHAHDASGQIELRKIKGADVKVVNTEYTDKGIRMISPIGKYFTFATKWLVFSNNKKEKVGEIGTYIGAKVDTPAEQTIDVTDWNISDQTPQWYGEQRQSERRDTVSNGVFHITPWTKYYVTKTNRSSHRFTVTWDKTVIYTDEFGNDVEFLALDPKPSDKGGVATLKALSEENNFERKEMTTTMNLVVREDNADYSGKVIFRKAVEKEELVGEPTPVRTLTPIGNGQWKSDIKVSYTLKLAGKQETSPVSQNLEWSITNDSKSHLILSSATATYTSTSAISWGSPTKTTPQTGISLSTTTGTVNDVYSTLTDKYSVKKQTAKYTCTIFGKEYTFEMLAPTEMTVSHKSATLVDGKRTASEGGKTYDVWDHSGTVTANVVSSDNSQKQEATDLKEIWVEKQVVGPGTPADYYLKGLSGYMGGNKFFNRGTGHWSDGLLYEGSEEYLIIVRNYTVNGDGKETYLSSQVVRWKKSEVGKDSYDAVLCAPNGEILPGFITIRGTSWTIEGPLTKPDSFYEQHTQQEANNSGIKNQPQDNNATCSAVITVNNVLTPIDGKKYFTTTVKTSAHNYGFTVADEELKK